MATEAPAVLTERREDVLVITINRHDARNAVNLAVAEGISAALDELDGSAELRAGVLTGTGRSFSAGLDLKAFTQGERPWAGDRGFAGIVERPPRTPIIAAIEGFAVAGGFEMALACDLIVAGRSAKLGIPEVKRSLVAGAGGLFRLPRALPRNVAMELILTGEAIDAERAAALGLVAFDLSLTHSRTEAMAFVVALRAREGGLARPAAVGSEARRVASGDGP